jgi:hypothetical protein
MEHSPSMRERFATKAEFICNELREVRSSWPGRYQPARISIRQRPQQNRIDHAENRRVGADTKHDCEHCDQSEPRALAQLPQRKAKVLPAAVHVRILFTANSCPHNKQLYRQQHSLQLFENGPDLGVRAPETARIRERMSGIEHSSSLVSSFGFARDLAIGEVAQNFVI